MISLIKYLQLIKQMSKKLPIIFILDMDKCIIGDSYYLFNIQNIKYFKYEHKDLWKKNISPYFIRPYLKDFILNIKKIFNNVDFFIYSFGDKEYVEKIIEYIEEIIDFKFNRPLFTRDDGLHTIDNSKFIKEINGFKDIILKSKKYSQNDIDEIFNNRVIIIDDKEKFWNNSQLIICNPYEYKPIPYFDYSFLDEIRKNEEFLEYIKNSNNPLFPSYLKSSISYDDFFLNYHLYTSELIRINLKKNNEAIKDEFFKNLFNLLKSRSKLEKPFSAKFIASINKKMIKI